MSVLRRAKLRTPDGEESIEYPLGVDAENVEVANGENLSQRLVRIDEDLEKNEEDITAVNEIAGINKQNIGAAEVRIDALERRSMSVDKKPYYFNTVADMKAYQKLIEGDMVITLGYYEVNDGGGAIYSIVKASSDLTVALDNGLYAELNIDNSKWICPEQFGAYGDGIHNDSEALNKCLNCAKKVILSKIYLYNIKLLIKNDIFGNGILVCGDSESSVSIEINFINNININGITFDYGHHTGRLLVLNDSNNINIQNCSFKNIGNSNSNYSNCAIFIRELCSNILIQNCHFKDALAQNVASFVWISNSELNKISQNIHIDNCIFDTCGPIEDGDAVKVLGGNYNCYLTVSNCYFYNCVKRAMKFQGRECHSINNYIYYNTRAKWAIDFQRGYGTSTNDTIYLDYDGEISLPDSGGMLYEGISITQGYVTIKNLKIQKTGPDFPNIVTSSAGIALSSLEDYDDGNIKNVIIEDCVLEGFAFGFRCKEEMSSVDNLKIHNLSINQINDTSYALFLAHKTITNSEIVNIKLLKHNSRLLADYENISNSFIDVNIDDTVFISKNFSFSQNNILINRSTYYQGNNFKIEKGKMIVYSTTNNNPSGSTYAQWSSLRNAPIGTIIINKGFVNNIFGYISTSEGTGSAAGTFIPITLSSIANV